MRRYLLFTVHSAVGPFGGWDDFAGFFDAVQAAKVAAKKYGADSWHIVDTATGDVFRYGGAAPTLEPLSSVGC